MDRLEMRLADARPFDELDGTPGDGRCALWVRLPRRARGDRGDARDRRRLRAVRDLAGARAARRRQQPRQHAARRAAASRPSGSSPTSACTRSPTASATASCTSGPRTARCSAPRASPPSCASGATSRRPARQEQRPTMTAVPQRYGHHRPVRRRPARASTASGSRSSPTSATPTCGRRSPAAPTRSRRSRSPRRGRRRCGSARRSSPCTRAAPRTLAQSDRAHVLDAAPGRVRARDRHVVERDRRAVERHPVREAVPARPRHDAVPPRRARGREGHRRVRDVLGEGLPPRRPRSTEQPPILVAALATRACCGSPAARATARSSTGSRPTTCATVVPHRRRGQGDRRPASSCCRPRTATSVRAVGRRMIAAYLNVPVYAAFHEWLGRGDVLQPMWDAWKAGDRAGRDRGDPRRGARRAHRARARPSECREHVAPLRGERRHDPGADDPRIPRRHPADAPRARPRSRLRI